jgi:hypothetical protein
MDKNKTKLELLKKKQDQLSAKIQKLESLEKSRERKRDTRRKILVGSYFLSKANEENTLPNLYKQIESYLNRDADKELFNQKYLDKE